MDLSFSIVVRLAFRFSGEFDFSLRETSASSLLGVELRLLDTKGEDCNVVTKFCIPTFNLSAADAVDLLKLFDRLSLLLLLER